MKIDTNTICGCEDNDFCVKFSENIGVLSEKVFNHLYEFNTYEDLLSGIITSGLIILPSQGDSGVVGVNEPDTTKRGVYMYDNGVWKMYVDTYSEDIIAELNQKSTATNLENGTGTGSLVQKRLKSDGVTWTTAKAYQGASTALGGGTQAGRTEDEFNTYFWDNVNNVALNGGQGKNSDGKILDNRGLTYSKSYSYSIAEGETTKAPGRGSHSEGSHTQAIGEYSHSEGYISRAVGDASHSEGWGPYSLGRASHSEGEGTRAEAVGSHAEGNMTKAKAPYSHAEGIETESQGEAAHSEGYGSQSVGNHSHAEGDTTTANGLASHSEGRETKTGGNYSHVEGYKAEVRNVAYTAPAGGGSGSGVTGGDDEQPDFSVEEHRGEGSHAEGILTISSGYSSHAEGAKTVADGMYAHSEGLRTYAKGNQSHAEGLDTSATGRNSHAEGSISTASGESSHAEGHVTKAIGENSHAEGSTTTASRPNSHAEGDSTIASGENSHAEGTFSKASGLSSHAEGWHTQATNNFQHAEGKYNADNPNALHIVGNGTSATNRKNAFVVLEDGRAKVQSAPVDSDDVVRKQELDTKLDSSEKSKFVDLTSAQIITGSKTFTAGVIMQNGFLALGSAAIFGAGIRGGGGTPLINVPNSQSGTTYMALAPNTAPTADSIIINSSTRTPTWKPVSELGGNALKVTVW